MKPNLRASGNEDHLVRLLHHLLEEHLKQGGESQGAETRFVLHPIDYSSRPRFDVEIGDCCFSVTAGIHLDFSNLLTPIGHLFEHLTPTGRESSKPAIQTPPDPKKDRTDPKKDSGKGCA